jgi:hypothetical protein
VSGARQCAVASCVGALLFCCDNGPYHLVMLLHKAGGQQHGTLHFPFLILFHSHTLFIVIISTINSRQFPLPVLAIPVRAIHSISHLNRLLA